VHEDLDRLGQVHDHGVGAAGRVEVGAGLEDVDLDDVLAPSG
jgi:hypothetical protein